MRINDMTQSFIDPAQAQKAQSEAKNFKASLESAMSNQDKDKLKAACRDFESVFLNMMLQSMRATVPKSDFLGQNKGREMFESLLDQEVTKDMAKAGGVGLADMMFKQMTLTNNHNAKSLPAKK